MCGIFGVVDVDQKSISKSARGELLKKMGQIMVHRGPDDEGFFLGEAMGFGMRRLSILDIEGGHQPIPNEDESIWVVCNGEIYNFRELRITLEEQGHRFRTFSDTEVIVHLYEEIGLEVFGQLRGMFAVAIWDGPRSRFILGRDRLGEKPLYIRKEPHRVLFSSELKSILQDGSVPRRLNFQALQEYLALGYVPAPWTLLEGIEKILPGHFLMIQNGKIHEEKYWDVQIQPSEDYSEEEWIEQVRNAFMDSVKTQLVSDVPLGAFLSGGIDSSAIVAAMARSTDQPVKTFAIGFGGEDQYYNELPYARIVADAMGTDHHEIMVTPDVASLLPKLLWYLEEPIADSAFITTYLVSELARKSVKVILSGVGGDELFGGYRRYLGGEFIQYYKMLPKAIRNRWLPAVFDRLPKDRHSYLSNMARYVNGFLKTGELTPSLRYMSYVGVFSPEILECLPVHDHSVQPLGNIPYSKAMERYFDQAMTCDDLGQVIYVDLKTSLPDDLLALTDKMTMAASIECRAPFIDHKLVELANRIPSHLKIHGFTTKRLLKKAVSPWLPEGILKRPKRGFGAPLGAWLRKDLEVIMNETLSESQVRKRGLFRWDQVKATIASHRNRQQDHTDHLLTLINLELWLRIFIDGNGYQADPESDAVKSILRG
ncbi:asparagine synthase (glutamine-hydrolyzing) [Candidatus Nitrospira neomarina]|uniref:asparagine synthase (glutamine-hydrolyzing) n=1 Tax=Candidatus Nitrospira neomarina TaxID=3020899 RepID=A0AA96JXJ6_9BACT|nr:asparagine synthase (glutamine-hydrolyzing) [Candidatus Nitrospira neomarina]WNM63972.1 asparagine synthase (glutamine-hydrolyzing) [Candidatus Nitrospira neomarina]